MAQRPSTLLIWLPPVFITLTAIVPLVLTVIVSFWRKDGLEIEPALSLASYQEFLGGARREALLRTFTMAIVVTIVGSLIAYPIAYQIARRSKPAVAQLILLAITLPFLVNYLIRSFAWAEILGRNGVVNKTLADIGLINAPVDWFLYSPFAAFVGLTTSFVPIMIFPIWLSLSSIDQKLLDASSLLGAGPMRTFCSVTFPLSTPGLSAACLFCFVGVLGESAVPIILGGAGYQLIGNSIESAISTLNYPLAAAMASVVIGMMAILIISWAMSVDLRAFFGKLIPESRS